jgi:hypothetical protein
MDRFHADHGFQPPSECDFPQFSLLSDIFQEEAETGMISTIAIRSQLYRKLLLTVHFVHKQAVLCIDGTVDSKL